MERIAIREVKLIFVQLNKIMEENREHLIELDGVMGDGDLGITMQKAFSAALQESEEYKGTRPGDLFAKVGMKISQAAPSTMGTLLAMGFMKGGKSVSTVDALTIQDVATFFRAFTDAIMTFGKTRPGNKTVVDSLDHAANSLQESATKNEHLKSAFKQAYQSSKNGVEETKEMVAQHGRAAYYKEKSVGVVDPGATVGMLLVYGFNITINQQEENLICL